MSESNMFNIEDLMDSAVEGASSTQLTLIPEGEWQAFISKYDGRVITVKSTGEQRPVVDVTWQITSQEVIDAVNRDNPTVRQSLWLDLDSNGQLDMSKGMNVQLGRLREALNQNGPGAWSWGQLEGAPAIIRVEHNPDRNDAEKIYANVSSVAAA